MRALLQRRMAAWIRRRQGPDRLPVTLQRRRLYILPTPTGLAYGALLFMMLIAGLNYANSLALLLTFLLAGMALVAMHACHRNLLGLAVIDLASEDSFAGEQASLRLRLANPTAQPRIGIVWGGNPNNHNDRKRSVPFAQLASIVEVGAEHLVSLQKGGAKTQVDLAATKIFDAEPYLDDFAATAGLLAELDLTITVCTSPAHLAGAMGRPGWVMLCFDPHWPWLLEREDSPWYPNLRLFRQDSPGDWAPVVAHVAEELKKFIAGDRSVLKPKPWNGPSIRQNIHAVDLTEH